MTIKKIELEGTEYQGWDKWAEKFKPINNHFSNDPEQLMFETYGDEVEFVKAQLPNHIWTWVDGDMSSLLVAGYHYVNRIGYYITQIPWDSEWDSCLLSVEVECECYDEDRAEDGGEYGDPDCSICEGYGLKTEYVN